MKTSFLFPPVRKRLFQFLLLTSLITTSRCDDDDSDKLPPATQVGANTFGCLVNGEVWVPKGYDGTPNLHISYESEYGALELTSYRYTSNNTYQYIILFSNNISQTGDYTFQEVTFRYKDSCYYWSLEPSTLSTGLLTVTKLDLNEGIISGEFYFSMADPESDCEQLNATEGRFDMKI